MPEPTTDSVAPVATLTSSTLTNGQKRFVLFLSGIFAILPLAYVGDLELQGVHLSDLDASGFFFTLGVLPGAIGIIYHLLLANTRRAQGRALLEQYYAFRNSRAHARVQDRVEGSVEGQDHSPTGAIAASLFLTGIFLLIAVFAGYEASEQKGAAANGVQGMMYAGLGSYVAVLYYMVARLYANALSSRFILTSALRTASAVALGWVFGIVGITAFAGEPAAGAAGSGSAALASNAVLFLVGLFHNMAIESLRARARKLFGSNAVDADELSITAVEGIDDTTAELLAEHGVSTIQHLATSEPGDLCDRTILPLDRVIDWMDQALLIRYMKANIAMARALGIRAATDLALVHLRNDTALMNSLAEKSGVPLAAIDHIARELRDDYLVALLYELEQGVPFPASTRTSTSTASATTMAPTIPIKAETTVSPAVSAQT
ncbi:MAG TPA: hypothetical protein VF432_09025 [Thermoanaerobaculia bacterium]